MLFLTGLPYFPMIPKPALCTNFRDPAIGTIEDSAGISIPPNPSVILLDSPGNATSSGIAHLPKRWYSKDPLAHARAVGGSRNSTELAICIKDSI
jgi:hypothetical protein